MWLLRPLLKSRIGQLCPLHFVSSRLPEVPQSWDPLEIEFLVVRNILICNQIIMIQYPSYCIYYWGYYALIVYKYTQLLFNSLSPLYNFPFGWRNKKRVFCTVKGLQLAECLLSSHVTDDNWVKYSFVA